MPVSAFTRRLLFNVQPVNRCVVIFRCLLTCPVNLSVRQSSIEPTLAPRSVHFCAIIGRDFSILTFIFRLSKFICYPVSICPLLVPVTRGLPNPILLPPCHNPSLPSICVATNIQSRLHHGLIHPVRLAHVQVEFFQRRGFPEAATPSSHSPPNQSCFPQTATTQFRPTAPHRMNLLCSFPHWRTPAATTFPHASAQAVVFAVSEHSVNSVDPLFTAPPANLSSLSTYAPFFNHAFCFPLVA